MAFISIKPTRKRHENLEDKVRITFLTKGDSSRIRVYFGMEIGRKFGLNKGTRAILLADIDVMLLQLKKDADGYKIGQLGRQLCIQAPWPYKTENVGEGLRFVNPTIRDGNLEVNLPKGLYEDKDQDIE
jgi:hypothetical protein